MVCVDHREDSEAAVVWAAREATARGVPLAIVHVESVRLHPCFSTRDTQSLLASFVERAAVNHPSLVVGSELRFGAWKAQLAELSASAQLLVVEKGAADRDLAAPGSVVDDLLDAPLHCPLVIVPALSLVPEGSPARVVVGLLTESGESDRAVLLAAARAADLRASVLDLVVSRPWPASERQRSARPLWSALDNDVVVVRARYPLLSVSICFDHTPGLELLKAQAVGAELVVVNLLAAGAATGTAGARTLAAEQTRATLCPVMVVPDRSGAVPGHFPAASGQPSSAAAAGPSVRHLEPASS